MNRNYSIFSHSVRKVLSVLMALTMMFTLFAVLTTTVLAADEAVEETAVNLLASKQPIQYYVSGGGFNPKTRADIVAYYSDDTANNRITATEERLSGLTNGITDMEEENILYYKDYAASSRALVFVYDLGAVHYISSIKLIGETNEKRANRVQFYAGNSFEVSDTTSFEGRNDLFDHRIDTFGNNGADENGIAQQDLSGVYAQYIAVAVGWSSEDRAWIRELEVYGVALDEDDNNLIANQQPAQFYLSGGGYNLSTRADVGVYYSDNTSNNRITATEDRLAGLTNGFVDISGENRLYFADSYYTDKRALVLVYDLGDIYDLSAIKLIGEAGDKRIGGVQFYAGNSFEISTDTNFDGRKDLFTHRIDAFGDDSGVDAATGIAQQDLTGVSAR